MQQKRQQSLGISCVAASEDSFDQSSNDDPGEPQQKRAWILGRLSWIYKNNQRNSLQNVVWIKLNLDEDTGVTPNISQRLLYPASQGVHSLLPESSILQVFDEAKQELLILGESGVGKSTLLLQLARELLGRAAQDEQHPLPVIVPIPSWTAKRLPLQDWLSEQISQIYGIPLCLSKRWVKERRFLPLLDGLDEIDEAARPECIAAIHIYHRDYPGMLVVCGRSIAIESNAAAQLALQNEVIVQSLFQEQVDALLAQVGQPLEAFRQEHAENATLRELITTPLMLAVCMLAYHETSVNSLPQEETLLQRQVWQDYTQRMMTQSEHLAHHSWSQTQEWLGWLAQKMQKRSESIFFLESLQPDWLPRKQRILYHWSCGLVFGLLGALIFGLIFGVFGALSGGLFGLLLGTLRRKIKPVETFAWSWKRASSGIPGGLLIGLTSGLASVLVYETFVGLSAGPVIGLLYILAVGLPAGVPVGLLGGILGGLLGSVVYGLSREQLFERSISFANTGIYRSATNGLAGALLGGLLGCLAGEFLDVLAGRTLLVLSCALVGILIGALICGLWAVIQHLLLRFWLWRSKRFPWRVQQFLNEATDGLLLQCAGRGYGFLHHLLCDYFANLDEPEGTPAPINSLSNGTSEMPLATEPI